jgi:hypothetical protein
MLYSRFLRPRLIITFILILLGSAVAYAFAATNTVSSSGAGDGATAIASDTLDTTTAPNTTTSLHVSLETNGDPTKIVKVRFTVIPAAGAAAPGKVSALFLTSAGNPIGSWYNVCANLSGTTWECTPGGAPAYVQSGIKLRVVAAQ